MSDFCCIHDETLSVDFDDGPVEFIQNPIDLCNDETFGSGAVDDDWEFDHNQLVELDFPHSSSEKGAQPQHVINEEELELSNQQLAAAVEELVLNSDQDQDAIDPAIVSLRKQSLPKTGCLPSNSFVHSSYVDSVGENLYGSNKSFGFQTLSGNVWNEASVNGQSFQHSHLFSKLTAPPHTLQHGYVNGKQESISPILEDDAIVTAIRDRPQHNLLSSPLIVKAEDLEREMQSESSRPRLPSPTFGISIPKPQYRDPANPIDRSLPARSISPVFGSPKPTNLPIGTPPNHILMDMIQEHEKNSRDAQNEVAFSGDSVTSTTPSAPHSNFVQAHPMRYRPPLVMGVGPPGMFAPPPPGAAGPNFIWPMPHQPIAPLNPMIAQDIMHRLGVRVGPRHVRLHPPQSGSDTERPPGPIPFRPPALMPPLRAPGTGLVSPGMPIPLIRMRGPMIPTVRLGPGQLHPEHSKFVRMKQHQNLQRGNQHDDGGHHHQHRNNSKHRDRHSNIMTDSEKDWVIRIQMMALQSDRPEIDDYYYQNFVQRRLHEGSYETETSTVKRLITPIKPNMDGRKYVPVQFSNSLGKLTSSSVYNPRQIIDLRQGTTQDDEGDSSELRQTLSKRLVVYKTIEKAYDIVMSIEDLRRQPKSIEKTNKCVADGECLMKIRSLVEVLSLDVEFNVHNDPVFPIMKIRKGKKLILRAMSFIAQEQRDKIVQSIFAHLSILIKRDARDGILHEMYPLLSRTLSEMGCGKFVVLLHSLSTFSLASAVKDQVGASLVCNLIARGSEIFDVATAENDNDSVQWSKFACDVCDVILAVANPKEGSRHVAPAVPVVLLERFPVDLVGALSEAARRESSVPQLTSSFQRLISVGAGDARD